MPTVAERFIKDTADHVMTVLHDDGLYRHIRFAEPGTSMYLFDLVTWPGCLTVSGDMGCYTFRRNVDMFEFFAGKGQIDYRYWAEKAQNAGEIREYDEHLFRQSVREHVVGYLEFADVKANDALALWAEVHAEVIPEGYAEDCARNALDTFNHDGFEFTDAWEWDLKGFTFRFLWICHAIQSGIEQYGAAS